jgi:hypothetical protein
MQMKLRGLLILSTILIVAIVSSHSVFGQTQIPFEGLRLVYFSETTQAVQQLAGINATAWITLVFHNVSGTSSKLDINVDGNVMMNSTQRPFKFNDTVDFPTDRDTLIFLRNGGQDNLTIYAGPSGLTIPSLPGLTIDLTRSWNLHDKPLIRTPVGSFPGYRYHTSFNSIPIPTGETVNFDFYASYEAVTQVLFSGEVWATLRSFSEMIAQTELRETNLISAQGPSRCLIATATYGSELAAPVQFLRDFRDNKIEKTFAGSNFMAAFNLWYYSFSPTVAQAIYASPQLRTIMQILFSPLVAILQASATLFATFGFQPEMAALLTGLAASAMIGVFYLWLPSILVCRRYGRVVKRALKPALGILGIGVLGLAIAELTSSSALAAFSSATVVLSNMFLFAALPSKFPARESIIHWVSKR